MFAVSNPPGLFFLSITKLFITNLLNNKKCEWHQGVNNSEDQNKDKAIVDCVQSVAYGWVDQVCKGYKYMHNCESDFFVSYALVNAYE